MRLSRHRPGQPRSPTMAPATISKWGRNTGSCGQGSLSQIPNKVLVRKRARKQWGEEGGEDTSGFFLLSLRFIRRWKGGGQEGLRGDLLFGETPKCPQIKSGPLHTSHWGHWGLSFHVCEMGGKPQLPFSQKWWMGCPAVLLTDMMPGMAQVDQM